MASNLSPHRFVVVRRRLNHMAIRKRDQWFEEIVSRHKSLVAARKARKWLGNGGYQGTVIRRLTRAQRWQG